MEFVDVYFSLGSNLGDRKENILNALAMMDKAFCTKRKAVSSIIETPAYGFSGPSFLNCAALYRLCRTGENAEQGALHVLDICKWIEGRLGREEHSLYGESGERLYRSRPIDIDILFYGNARIDCGRPGYASQRLIVPHEGIMERGFVMVPLQEIAKESLKKAFPEYFREYFG